MSNQSIDFARFLNIRSAISPVVAPDGAQVAFLTDITGNYQVWSVATSGEPTWPRQLTFFADKVWELYGTPAAEHLVAVGDVGGNERQQFYLIDGYGMRTDDAGKHAVEEHDVRRLTRDEAIHRFGAFSGDGMRIALTSNARNGVDFDLYLLDITTGAQTLVAEMAGNQTVLALAPDERRAHAGCRGRGGDRTLPGRHHDWERATTSPLGSRRALPERHLARRWPLRAVGPHPRSLAVCRLIRTTARSTSSSPRTRCWRTWPATQALR
ncbi:MAG: hypothetical protein R2851_10805 [Caldilineaceae bacterium]